MGMKILVAIPCFENVKWQCMKSVYEMDRPEGCEVDVEVVSGYGPAVARNRIACMALDRGYDYVLYIDSDQVALKDLLVRLLACEADFSAGWALGQVGNDITNVAKYFPIEKRYDFFRVRDLPSGVVDVDAVGFAACLIKTELFSRLIFPYFKYVEYSNRMVLSEDLYFCDLVRNLGVLIKCDMGLKVDHIKTLVI
jgi:GT2 family glycosyltransferase